MKTILLNLLALLGLIVALGSLILTSPVIFKDFPVSEGRRAGESISHYLVDADSDNINIPRDKLDVFMNYTEERFADDWIYRLYYFITACVLAVVSMFLFGLNIKRNKAIISKRHK